MTPRLWLALGLAVLLLSGCAGLRPAIAPPPIPDAFARAVGEERSPPALQRWWEVFDDGELDALMDEAFLANLDLTQAHARIEQNEAVLRSTTAARHPTLNLTGQAGRGQQPGLVDDSDTQSYRLSVAAAFELDLWGKLRQRSAAARFDAEAGEEDLKLLYLSLSAQLADLYFLTAEQQAQLDLTDGTIAAFADTLNRVERRYREGLVPSVDVYQARQNLAAALSRRPLFEANLATSEHALSLLLGRYPGALENVPTALPAVPDAFPAGLPADLLARRPDVQAAWLRLQAVDARLAAAIAERFPSINLLGSYGLLRSDMGFGVISGAFFEVLASLTQPLYDGGRRRAEVERSRAVVQEQLARYQQTVLRAFVEVEDALVRNRTAEARIAHLLERSAAAEAALRLSLDRYMQGLSDYLPVLTAQSLHFEAESQLLAARRQLFSDRISLARALGGRWMEEELEQRKDSPPTDRTDPTELSDVLREGPNP
jgi:NodT family efflux transporter outer membrane factor (OMF) lipoprotein